MFEYKCVACGHIREIEKETLCNCTECGYTMFPAHLNRKDVLIGEITKFLNAIVLNKIENDYFDFTREVISKKTNEPEKIYKEEDDARFPDFGTIKSYVLGAKKTEEFISRLNNSFEQIENHFGKDFREEYKTDFEPLLDLADAYESVLIKTLELFGENVEFSVLEFKEPVCLKYSQTTNQLLYKKAQELLSVLKELSEKIYKFIKQNNIFGVFDKVSIKNKLDAEKNYDYFEEMQSSIREIKELLTKQIQVDIFSDGQNELKLLLRPLFKALEVIMKAPLFDEEFIFETENGTFSKEEFYSQLIARVTSRYPDVLSIANSYFIIKNDDELFKVYNNILQLDKFNFLGVDKSALNLKGQNEEKLNNLIGLSSVKESIRKIKAYALSNKDSEALNLHMCFYGNPGTGKTEVARIIAGILYENKILPTQRVVEVDRSGLVGQYVGETPQKTMSKIHEAMGGVLFIDEAYSLVSKDVGFDYGHEAIATLIKAMEDYRGKFCVIFAGYKNQMLEMMSTNPGFKSRIQFELEFANYSREELSEITSLMLQKRKYKIDDVALQKVLDITDVKRREPNFANAREIRNILDGVIMCQNLRSFGVQDNLLGLIDVNKYIEDAKINLSVDKTSSKILTAEEELEQLIGLDSVKRLVKKIKAFAKRNKNETDFNLHMCFYGNPGTGKTEVARILSSILYEAGVLPEAKLVETDAHGLIGKVVGETAPKTQAKIQDAMGGVLFIDEAYGLSNDSNELSQSYGNEAIEVLLKNMEDQRGRFCVILAGYKDEMKQMLSSNPGFESRIQFTLEFPDYTREELGEIAVRFLGKKGYTIDDSALKLLLDVTDYYRETESFANARTVRNLLDQVIMNQNLRTEDDASDLIIRSDVEDYLFDENIDLSAKSGTTKIGFV